MIALAHRVTLSLFALLAAVSCMLPPVDVDLSVSLASADQMTLRQSFALRRDSLDRIEPYSRAFRYYPSLSGTLTPTVGAPLGYFVIETGASVIAYLVTIDGMSPLQLSKSEAGLDLPIGSDRADAYQVVHTRRATAGEEKLVIYRARPAAADFAAGALATGYTADVTSDSLSAELFAGAPVVAAGAYAAAWPPAEAERLAALSVNGTTLQAERIELTAASFNSGTNVWNAEAPPAAPAYGRLVLRYDVVEDFTLLYAGFADANRYRTYVTFTGQPDPEYRELRSMSGRLETVLASGEVLTRTRDRWAVWSAVGEPRGSFAAGNLQFAHERNDIDGSGEWHAVFTLTYWGRVQGEDYLFVRVYSVPSARLRGIE